MNDDIGEVIRKIKLFAWGRVPFYKRCVNFIDIKSNNFDEFPIIDKKILRENLQAFIAENVGELVSEYTSGSTGHPLTLYKTKREMMYLESMLLRERKKIIPDFNRLKLIKFYAELNSGEADCCSDKIHREKDVLYLSMLHMDESSLEEYVHTIQSEIEAGWMMGPPSAIYRLAKCVHKLGLNCDKIKFVELTGEMVFDYQRDCIKKAFGCPVRNHYGTREFWAIAYECEYGNMHIFDNHVYVENSDEGFIVSTLDQRTMPLIRYRLGDKGEIIKNDCKCGKSSLVLKTFAGRTTDYIKTASGRLISSIAIYMIVVDINLKFKDLICQFQMIQQDFNLFEVNIVLNSGVLDTEVIKNYFVVEFKRIIDDDAQINFAFVKEIQNDPVSGKYKYFITKLQ